MQIWIHDNKMKKIVALNNDIPDMLSYSNSTWHSYLDQATSTFDFTIPKFSNGELHEDIKLINDECFVSFYVNGSYQVFYIATLQEDDFNIQLTCNNTNLEYALEYANPFSAGGAQTIEWYLNHMDLLSFAAVEIGINEISDRKRTLTFDSQETKMARLQSLMSNFDAEFEFKVKLNRDGTYKRIAINIYQKADDTHHGIGSDRKDVVLYYSNGLKGVQVSSDKTQMFNAGVFTGKDGLSLNDVEISEKNADGIEEFYSRKGNPCLYAPLAMNRYRATMRAEGQDNWIRKDFSTEYENINDLKAYALRMLKQYAYPLMTYTASVQSKFIGNYSDLALGDTVKIIDNNFAGGLALEARVSEMIISFDNPNNNSIVFTNYRKIDNKPTSALQSRIDKAVEDRLPYRIELATTGGVTFKNNEGETIVKPNLFKGNKPFTTDVSWRWALDGNVTVGMQYLARASIIKNTAVLTVSAYIDNNEVATTEITLTNVTDGVKGPQGDKGDTGNGIANTVITYGLSMSDTTEPATWSSNMPVLVKGMYLWTRSVQIYTNGTSSTSYQKGYIAKDGAQGVPGKPGADGKTPYIHFAFASSADGKTGFSFTESGQQYQGYYTDFVQISSTDPTKYTWMDRRAGVEVGTRNLWIQSKATGGFVEETLPDNHITGQKKCYRITDNAEIKFNIEPDFSPRLYRTVTFSAWVKYENVVQGANSWNVFNCFKHEMYRKNSSTGLTSSIDYTTLKGFTGTSDWKYVTYTYDYAANKSYDQLKTTIRFNLESVKSGTAWVTGVMVQFGNVATGHVWAPEDVQDDIDSKADQALTQQQLNALAEQNSIVKAEMEAKATIDTVNQWITAYQNYVNANDADKAKSEQALKDASERILAIRYEVNNLKVVWDAIDTYMSFQNEGLVIGKKDGSAYAKFSDDRISLFSGSSEVMYISQGTLNIANGIFTKTIQIGRFRFETHPADADMLVVRFVGG